MVEACLFEICVLRPGPVVVGEHHHQRRRRRPHFRQHLPAPNSFTFQSLLVNDKPRKAGLPPLLP